MPNNPQDIQSLFLRLVELPPADRHAVLELECGSDVALRQRVEGLLKAHEEPDSLLDRRGNQFGATVLSEADNAALATGVEDTGDGGLQRHGSKRSDVPEMTQTNIRQESTVGTVIAGRYTMVQRIGEGGMGEVWVAKQTSPVKRKVALKLIRMGMDSKAVLARFEQERQALALMDHPNIAKVLDGGITPTGQPFFVMELVNGLPLNKFCDEVRLDTNGRLELFVPICQAVQHAHQKGIVHRDLKPANILVTLIDGRPVPKVIDFGVAKATAGKLTDESLSTQFGAVVGTLEYMSPEQAGFSGEDIDTRADIYSLGVILYELLTGLRPLDAQRLKKVALTEMIRIIREDEPSKPSTRLSTEELLPSLAAVRQTEPKKLMALLRGELDWVVMKCLEKQRERRYETASALAREIQRYLADEAVEARPPSVRYRLGKFFRRHKGPVVAATLVMLTVVCGLLGTGYGLIRTDQALKAEAMQRNLAQNAQFRAEEQSQRVTQANVQLDAANNQLKHSTALAEFATGSHFIESNELGKGIAHLARSLRTDPSYWPAAARLVSALTDRGIAIDDLPPIMHDQPIYDYLLDRTTGLLVTRGENYDLRIWSAWKAEQLMEIPATGNRRMPSLSPDGHRILLVDANGSALIYEPFRNPRSPLAALRAESPFVQAVLNPAAGPGLIVATRIADGDVQFWNGETGEALSEPLSGTSTDGGFLSFTRDGQWLVGSFADGRIGVWPVPGQTESSQAGTAQMLAAQAGSLLTLTPDSKTVVERAADSLSIRFWDLATGTPRSDAVKLSRPLTRVSGEPGIEVFGESHGHDFEFSEDGRRMTAVAHDSFQVNQEELYPYLDVHLFDTSTGQLIHTTTESNVTHHEENLVSGLVATVVEPNRLVIRNLDGDVTLVDQTFGPLDAILTTRFSPAGDRILVALTDRRLIMFNAWTGDSLTDPGDSVHISNIAGGSGRAFGQTHFMRHRPRLKELRFSPEGDVFYTHYRDGSFQAWNAYEGLAIAEPKPGCAGVMEFSTDGRWLLTHTVAGGKGGTRFDVGKIHVLNRDLSAARYRTIPYRGWAAALHFTPDGRYGLVGRDGLVIFDATTGEKVSTIDAATTGTIRVVQRITWNTTEAWFSPSGAQIVAVCHSESKSQVKVFQTTTGKLLHTLPIEEPMRARFAGEKHVVVAHHKSSLNKFVLTVWDLESGEMLAEELPAVHPDVLTVSPDGRRIASCSEGIALIDATGLKPIGDVRHHRVKGGEIYHAVFSPDSRRLVTGGLDGTVRVWQAETGDLEAEFEIGGWPRWVDFSPDSRRVLAGGGGVYDVPSALNVWEFVKGGTRRVGSPMIHTNTIQHARFSADNQFVVAGDRGGEIRLWDLETSLQVIDPVFVDGDIGGITRVGLNPQGSRMYGLFRNAGELHHRPLPPRDIPVPDWFLELAEGIAHQRVTGGALEPLTDAAVRKARTRVESLPAISNGENFYLEVARWLLADHATRQVAPFASVSVPEEVEELLRDGSLASLRRAHHISPTNASVQAALAKLERLVRVQSAAEQAIAARRTRDAIPHFVNLSSAKPEDTVLSMKVAALHAWFGQEAELNASRQRILKFAIGTNAAGTAERAAKACSILPSTDKDQLEAALALARTAVQLGKDDQYLPYFQMALGMAEYRSGHFLEADAALTSALADEARANPYVAGISPFYRAMSLFRLGREDEARDIANEATARMKPLPRDEENPLAGSDQDHDDLILWLAYKEAKALIQFESIPGGSTQPREK